MLISTLIWFLLMFLTIKIADNYDRSMVGWALLGFFITPIVSIIGLLIVGRKYY